MKKLLILACLSTAAGSVVANDYDDRWYVTPSASFVKTDGDKNSRTGLSYGLGMGKFLNEQFSLDLELDHGEFDTKDGLDYNQGSLGLMGRYHFQEKMGFRPYLGLGVGGLYHDDNSSSSIEAMMNIAGGLHKSLTDNVKLRTEIRYRLENSDDTFSGEDLFGDFLFNAGLNVALGQAAEQTTKTTLVEPAPQLDGDNDGVPDANDRCPRTPPGTKVDATGCAIVDGDDDGDGVPNSQDACPNSLAGAVVGSDGCKVKVVIELQGVHFDFDKATLKPESINILNAAVKTLGDHGTIMVEVAGHTDSKGTDEYNQALSLKRAKVVHAYLVDHGISSDRMTWKGYGESQPIATNDTDEGRARNRRTELIVK